MNSKRPVEKDEPKQRYLVPVVSSTFRVLEELSVAGGLTLNEVIKRTGIPKATAFRILTTLCYLGYTARDDAKRYYSGQRLASLVSETALDEGLRQVSLPYMTRLRDQYGETVNLGRRHQERVRYVEVVPSEFALRLHETPGATVPLHASSLGKAILAFSPREVAENLLRGHELEALTRHTVTDVDKLIVAFEQIQGRGYARDEGEIASLATCVAAPILDSDDHAIAAISISGPSSRFNPPDSASVIEDLVRATTEISRRLGQQRSAAAITATPSPSA